MGNIFYMLLTELWPFENVDDKEAQQRVVNGVRPDLPKDKWNFNDTIIQTLMKAMILCQTQNETERASARQVERILKDKLLELNTTAFGK
jgi:hypothetical protein